MIAKCVKLKVMRHDIIFLFDGHIYTINPKKFIKKKRYCAKNLADTLQTLMPIYRNIPLSTIPS